MIQIKPHVYSMGGSLIVGQNTSEQNMISFISDIVNDVDRFYEKRQILRKKIFDYYDGNNSQRAVKLLGI